MFFRAIGIHWLGNRESNFASKFPKSPIHHPRRRIFLFSKVEFLRSLKTKSVLKLICGQLRELVCGVLRRDFGWRYGNTIFRLTNQLTFKWPGHLIGRAYASFHVALSNFATHLQFYCGVSLRFFLSLLASCAGITCHARREIFLRKLRYFSQFLSTTQAKQMINLFTSQSFPSGDVVRVGKESVELFVHGLVTRYGPQLVASASN